MFSWYKVKRQSTLGWRQKKTAAVAAVFDYDKALRLLLVVIHLLELNV